MKEPLIRELEDISASERDELLMKRIEAGRQVRTAMFILCGVLLTMSAFDCGQEKVDLSHHSQ